MDFTVNASVLSSKDKEVTALPQVVQSSMKQKCDVLRTVTNSIITRHETIECY